MLHYQVLILCLIYTASEVNLTYITMSMLQVGNRLWKTDFFFPAPVLQAHGRQKLFQ